MAVFIAMASVLPLLLGTVFLAGSFAGSAPTPKAAWILGSLACLLLVLGTGLMSAAVFLWRNRHHDLDPDTDWIH